MSKPAYERLKSILISLYGERSAHEVFASLQRRLISFNPERPPPLEKSNGFSSQDAILITYGDSVCEENDPPLHSLLKFCCAHFKSIINTIHLLPFYPSSSDDGFSVIDYHQVDADFGDWSDIHQLSTHFKLMFDAVINHVSVQSAWFQAFLQGDPEFSQYFLVPEKNWDLSKVIRPRTSPLLTQFQTKDGYKNVWTTFSADQVDLNYHNPEVLEALVETILDYVQHGAAIIRLDAVAYVWKQSRTTCLNLINTHQIVQLLRAILDIAAPWVKIITETNIPHQENISYFGSGKDEADLVYNFALPPLILHTFYTQDSHDLTAWASALEHPPGNSTYFNFLASHDGIGLNPVRELLTPEQIDQIVKEALSHGGLVSCKKNPDGSETPYELNINYFDALNNRNLSEPLSLQVARFLCAHSIMLSLIGIPGLYYHSLLGSRGWLEGPSLTGQNRTINRQKFTLAALESELNDTGSLRNRVFRGLTQLLKIRATINAFDPHSVQTVIDCGGRVFGLLRGSPEKGLDFVIIINNISSSNVLVTLDPDRIGLHLQKPKIFCDLISGREYRLNGRTTIELQPYQFSWLIPEVTLT